MNLKGNILITGGAGFIGHHLIRYILENTKCNIISMDRIDTSCSLSRLQDIISSEPEWANRLRIVWHDLKSPVNKHVSRQIGQIDYILHLAAGSHVDRSFINPIGFVMDNVIGTTNLLEYARENLSDLKVFLNFSTDEVFGPAIDSRIFKEDDRHNPCNPYSATKSAAEQMCNAYAVSYGVPVITTHTMNVYGIRQSREKFIPLLTQKLLKNECVEIHVDESGNIGSRKYLHETDVASAILFLLENGEVGQKYNISSNEEVNNLNLAMMISNIMGKELKYNLVNPTKTRGKNDIRYSISGEKIKSLGWKQKTNLEQGLKQVIKWYENNPLWVL
jgi:dTDP-glucose 4,6-dehydratase